MLTLNRKGRPYGFFLGLYQQEGLLPPYDLAILDTDIPGAAPTWTRDAAGDYMLSFPSPLSEESAVAFVQIIETSGAMYCHVMVMDDQDVRILFRDQAGALVEANCSFAVMLYNYPSQLPA